MNSIEKITSRITREAEAYAEEALKTACERAEAIISDARKKAEDIKREYAERAETEAKAVISRAASSADVLERNILLDAKSVMLDDIYKRAEEQLIKADESTYFGFLIKTLKSAVEFLSDSEDCEDCEDDASDVYVLTLNAEDGKRFGKQLLDSVGDLLRSQGKRIELDSVNGDFSGGLRLRLGSVEASATVDTLLKAAREKTEADVYGILFR